MFSGPLDEVGHAHDSKYIDVINPVPFLRVQVVRGEVLAEGLQNLHQPHQRDDEERPCSITITHVSLLGTLINVGIEFSVKPESFADEVVP